MAERVRSAPPDLPGYTFVESIGAGGFADVFLYRQHRPTRNVAIKVLRAEHVSPAAIEQFDQEADVMAEVSSHPYIVTVYSSGVAPDGRPFIVMEHYPQPHFAIRARGGTMGVAEVLRTAVQISSAVHHAHESNIIHRDIKPANILTSEFGRPGLTDFGISGVLTDGSSSSSVGVTIEFAPPEALRNPEHATMVTGDVYSLAATVYALLSGRPPFWVVGGSNTEQDLITRTITQQVPPTGRSDTGPLEHLLATALHPDPQHRPATALAFARALQDVEQQLHLTATAIEARGDGAAPPPAVDRTTGDGTRLALKVVNPDGDPPPRAALPPRSTSSAPAPPATSTSTSPGSQSAGGPVDHDPIGARTVLRSNDATPSAVTPALAPPPLPVETPPDATRSRTLPPTPLLIGAGVAVVAILAFVIMSVTKGSEATHDDQGDQVATGTTLPPMVGGTPIKLPTDVEARWDPSAARYTVEWTEVDVAEGSTVSYRIRPIDSTTGEPTTDANLLEAFGPGWAATGGELTIERLQLDGAPAPCIDIMTIVDTRAVSNISPPVCP